MEELTKAYKCSFCGKLYQRKHFCEKHERGCWKNPDNFSACFNCKHYSKPQYIHYDHNDYQFVSHFCNALNKEMVSGKQIERNGRALWEYEDGPGTEQILREKMPRYCEHQEIVYNWDGED